MPLRLGSIKLKSFSHGVAISVDPSCGKLTGTRVHRPVTIVKAFDQTTLLLYRAVCEGRTITKGDNQNVPNSGIRCRGRIFQYLLQNVKFTTVAPYLAPSGMSSTHHETLELCYQAIAWKYTEGNIIYCDS